jgi:beta-ketodecanoyl-[acyl-carrier-protein] synthase
MNKMVIKFLFGEDIEDIKEEDAPIVLDRYANTASAGSIIAFHLHKADFKKNDIGVICSFGAGYSVGSLVVRKR